MRVHWLRVVAGLLVASPVATVVSARQAAVTAFVNVSVIPMDRERVLPAQTVLVRDGRIVAMGAAGKIGVPSDAVRIDGRGKFLLPGLGDMHAHLPKAELNAPEGPDRDQETPAKRAMAERELLLFLAHGVTTIRNMAGEPWHVALREQVARGELLGPRIYTGGPVLSSEAVKTPAAAAAAVAAQKAAAYDFIKMYDGWPDRTAFDTLAAAAKRTGIALAGHVPNILDPTAIDQAVAAGYRSLEHLHGYVAYLSSADDTVGLLNVPKKLDETKLHGLAATMRRADVWNVPTLTVLLGVFNRRDAARSAFYGKIIQALHEAGAGLLLGTDSWYCRSLDVWPADTSAPRVPWVAGFAIRHELEILVRVGGLTPYQALETGTRNVAAFEGTLADAGTVAVGKRADLILLTGNPLSDLTYTERPVGVMVGGRWLSREMLDTRLAALGVSDDPVSVTCQE